MDGNGRWAAQRSLPRTAGHRAAEAAVIDVIEAAHTAGVEWLSLYAFSTENWRRPAPEVDVLLRLVRRAIRVIRTSGEQRISNFMLWQVAYAEWVFPRVLWPDFRAEHFWECLEAYRRRERRLGGVRAPAPTGKGCR
ncbi:undecaprenyl diphosphate synthase family protein [Microbispora sp. CA-135349]|uniref:undecaprenyl diphosphate synthase family protein n=1 Tax=Microbispora sp. CA-135349 TaxID=3239953 RepID=UPI003D8A31DB